MKRIGSILLFWITTGCLLGCILLSGEITDGISYGIHLCLNSLIPSLFFFMILSSLILNSPLCGILARPFSTPARRLLRLDAPLFVLFLLSLIGGYPIGPRLIAQQLRAGSISRQTAQSMMPFCVNCSPAFLICYLSPYLWGDLRPGVMLYLSQVMAAILLAILSGFRKPIRASSAGSTKSGQPVSVLLVDSVNQAAKAMGTICSFVVAFCAFFPVLDRFLPQGGPAILVKGLLEVTAGCQALAELPVSRGILGAALFTSFGGVCVFFQIIAMISGSGISIWRWLVSRLLYTALSTGLCWAGLLLFPQAVSCAASAAPALKHQWFTTSPAASFCMILLAGFLLFLSAPPAKGKRTCHSNKNLLQ